MIAVRCHQRPGRRGRTTVTACHWAALITARDEDRYRILSVTW